MNQLSDRTGEKEWVMACNAQNEVMNLYFTIGTSCLSGSTMIYGLIMDKYGCRALRLAGMAAMAISCVLFTLASAEPRSMDFFWIFELTCFKNLDGLYCLLSCATEWEAFCTFSLASSSPTFSLVDAQLSALY